jgi:hypothetical protein
MNGRNEWHLELDVGVVEAKLLTKEVVIAANERRRRAI